MANESRWSAQQEEQEVVPYEPHAYVKTESGKVKTVVDRLSSFVGNADLEITAGSGKYVVVDASQESLDKPVVLKLEAAE